jgi:hypothetical protein
MVARLRKRLVVEVQALAHCTDDVLETESGAPLTAKGNVDLDFDQQEFDFEKREAEPDRDGECPWDSDEIPF